MANPREPRQARRGFIHSGSPQAEQVAEGTTERTALPHHPENISDARPEEQEQAATRGQEQEMSTMVDIPPISYTTRIDVSKTVAEITDLLARAGADRVATSYENGRPSGITFALETASFGTRVFELPVNIGAMHRKMTLMSKNRKLPGLSQRDGQSREQAERVAWRVVRSWLASQLALLETEMLAIEQILFPYLKTGGFESPTVYEVASAQPHMLAIES